MDTNNDLAEGTTNEYDDAFDEATAEAPVEPEETPAEEQAEEETPAEEPAEEEAPAAEAEETPAEEPAEEEPAEEETPAAEAPAVDEAAVQRAADMIRAQQQRQQEQEAAPAGEPAPEPETPKTIDDYIPEDKRELVGRYRQEWSEVAEAEQLLRDAHLQQVQEKIYSELRGALAPVFETTQRLQVNAHLDAIRQVHSDVDDIKEDLHGWIAEQPEFVRPAYEQVAKQGSAQQVIELINYYKQAKGAAGAVPEVPAPSARTQQKPAPAKRQAPAAARKALAAAPSPSKAEVPGSSSPEDFDAAFDEAAGLG